MSHELSSLEPISGHHHPGWQERYDRGDEATLATINLWLKWRENSQREFPPGLATSSGCVIDGNHRFEAAKLLGVTFDCCEVVAGRDDNGRHVWIATAGNLVLR